MPRPNPQTKYTTTTQTRVQSWSYKPSVTTKFTDSRKTFQRSYGSANSPKGWRKEDKWRIKWNVHSVQQDEWIVGHWRSLLYATSVPHLPNSTSSFSKDLTVGPGLGNLSPQAVSPSSSVTDSLYRQALLKAYAKLKGMDIDLSIAVGEGRETVRMITNTVKRLSMCYANLRKWRFIQAAQCIGLGLNPSEVNRLRKKVRRYQGWVYDPKRKEMVRRQTAAGELEASRRFATETFLEFTYGWKPLLDDCLGAAKAFYNGLKRKGTPFVEVRAKGQLPLQSSKTTGKISTGQYIDTVEDGSFHRVRVILQWSLKHWTLPGEFAALGLTNPLNTAWQLLPLSFVADWFIPLGNFFNSLDATRGLTFHRGLKVVDFQAEVRRTYKVQKYTSSTSPTHSSTSLTDTDAYVGLDRKVYERVPILSAPTWMDRFPTVNLGLGSDQLTSAIALLSQRLRS